MSSPVLAALSADWLDLLLFLHILCAIVGFGAVTLNGLYGVESRKRPGPGGLAVMEANFRVSKVGEYFIYAVFVFGILLVVGGPSPSDTFAEPWLSTAMLLYIIGIGISHGVMIPTERKMIGLAREMVEAGPPPEGAAGPPPQAAQMEALGKRLGTFGPILNVLLVVILALMVFKPGQ